ncbi:hypothetical protein NQT62_05020 [Limnobacter humi]|uniref:PepSY domain-containing protein n=1 Tax=Limnobacter humi TaxID=1778671 RepID=A0ABT1WEI0_9BURK|nr:hypothetical protein [Limnobacter humi]MCQ8895799.1 hypothetical protein [Limnobacter humi]
MTIRAYALHRRLMWLAASAVTLWGLSGLLHPILTALGIQQVVFNAPTPALQLQHTRSIAGILKTAGIQQAQLIQVLPHDGRPLLQVTQSNQEPRRYFDMTTGQELPGQDLAQAAFIVRHYMKLPADRMATRSTFITEFSTEYPAVNRLLPVYKLEYPEANSLVAYVHTGTNALAAVTDPTKRRLQTAFQWLHTWSWMPEPLAWVRGPAMVVLLGTVLLMTGTGLTVFFKTLRLRKPRGWPRALHRWVGLGLAVPLAAWAFSGALHLLMNSSSNVEVRTVAAPPIETHRLRFDIQADWAHTTRGLQLAGFSIVESPHGELLYRLALKPESTADGIPILPDAIRNARFDGAPVTGPALYVNAETGQAWNGDDRQLAIQLATRYMGQSEANIRSARLITRFGPEYDFRNKRLPVWQIEFEAPLSSTVFIDTQSGVLADSIHQFERPERWSFSWLHKWAFVQPLGRGLQNWATGSVALACVLLLAVLGVIKVRRSHRPG